MFDCFVFVFRCVETVDLGTPEGWYNILVLGLGLVGLCVIDLFGLFACWLLVVGVVVT